MHHVTVHVSGPQDPQLRAFIKRHGELNAALTMPSKNEHIPHHPKINAAIEDLIDETRSLGIIPKPILDRIEELSKQWDLDSFVESAGVLWKKALDVYNRLAESYDTIVRHDKLANLLIRKVAWHPHQPLLAIALWNNSIWVYDLSIESWYSCGLSHPAQSRVMTLEWKPMSGVVLAVGCENGVALWHVFRDHTPTGTESTWRESEPLKDRPSEVLSKVYRTPTRGKNQGRDTAWVGLSGIEGLNGVDYMAWNPRGELLAVGSAHSSVIYIRDETSKKLTELRLNMRPTPPHFVRDLQSFKETISNVKAAFRSAVTPEEHTIIRPSHERGHYGVTVCGLSWSPCGGFLLVGYLSQVARVYETATWEYVEMKDIKGALQSVCWTPDGNNLIYSLQGDDLIRAIHFERRAGSLTWIPMNNMKMSFRYTDIETYKDMLRADEKNGDHKRLGSQYWKRFGSRNIDQLEEFGPIEELALDAHGERLAIRFRDTDLVGIALVKPVGPLLRDLDIFTPIGFVQDPGEDGQEADDDESDEREPKSNSIAFARRFNGGSLLAIAWGSGRINFVPFFYETHRDFM
ncbi:hypothetical protein BGZ65_012849 [Modicella reniformis]|uniref:Anaphase-promoting complex subunit 4-like WD40 domain-containing protein n=1 Tax=Modicella reniformis TaxID=1440133 RepID=A0A9P6M1A1_9FUNG|nr:hypothetical protein BGZ65_012849 [Modicella reniformis]